MNSSHNPATRHTAYRTLLAACLLTTSAASAQEAQDAAVLGNAQVVADTAAITARALVPTDHTFALSQLEFARVLDARVATRFEIKRLFRDRGLRYPAAEVFLRIFKRERSLELWVRPEGAGEFALLTSYDICALAGELGPKRAQGDNQTPEGFYFIDYFNPQSDYHLSLHLDYPNRHDHLRGAGENLGGDIFIHGGCSSEGCMALTDDGIRELYWITVEARAAGQSRIPVHIFPARLDAVDLAALDRAFADRPDLTSFWRSLKPAYDYFEQTRRVPTVGLGATGEYALGGAPLGQPQATPAGPATDARNTGAGPLGTPVTTPVKVGTEGGG